jgi:hypothetical protein
MELTAVVKVTEIDEVKIFLGAIEWAKDKVEDGDISKGNAYNRIIKAYDEMQKKLEEQEFEGGIT